VNNVVIRLLTQAKYYGIDMSLWINKADKLSAASL